MPCIFILASTEDLKATQTWYCSLWSSKLSNVMCCQPRILSANDLEPELLPASTALCLFAAFLRFCLLYFKSSVLYRSFRFRISSPRRLHLHCICLNQNNFYEHIFHQKTQWVLLQTSPISNVCFKLQKKKKNNFFILTNKTELLK